MASGPEIGPEFSAAVIRTGRRGLAAWSALMKTVLVSQSYLWSDELENCAESLITTHPKYFVRWECCPFVVDFEDQLQAFQASTVVGARSRCDRSGRP